MPDRTGRLALALLAFALAVVGCGDGTGSPTATGPRALEAGTYRSQSFQPQVTFTLPEGWYLPADTPDYLGLQPVSNELIGVHLFRDPLPGSQDLACTTAQEPGVGTAALAIVTWARSLPGLVTSTPRPVTIGGLTGIEIDLAIADGWTASCPFANGLPTVPLFVGQTGESFRWVIAGSERLRLSLFDLPGGGTLVVDVDAYDGSYMDALLTVATPIVASLEFATP
jgi:hypothetical protein